MKLQIVNSVGEVLQEDNIVLTDDDVLIVEIKKEFPLEKIHDIIKSFKKAMEQKIIIYQKEIFDIKVLKRNSKEN
jgi:hypothetical protein